MTQRNPMNDRYQDEHQGKTRKSAASAKPKTKAAATVRVKPVEKTKQQKKAEKKVERQKQNDLDRKYYNPPTPQYKRLRKIWWVLLIGAVVLTAFSWLGRSFLPEVGTYITLGLAYACIIGALYVDFSKIRKVRRAYQQEMESRKSKEQRALEKQQKAAQRSEKQVAEEKYEAAKAAEAEKAAKGGLLGRLGIGKSKAAADDAAAETSADAKAAASDAASEGNAAFERGKAQADAALNKEASSNNSAK